MTSLTRRTFLKGAAALPLATWLSSVSAECASPIRHDIDSPMGQVMLKIYADAVRIMQTRPADDPASWMWQWYTHFVDGSTSKSAELNRIFGAGESSAKSLAHDTWNTCQSHAGQNSSHFLPWHRMFVLFFEGMVREVTGRPDFTLPYWNYTSPDPAKRGVLPAAFRMPNDPVYGVLYRPNRTARANNGTPIHEAQPGDVMDISQQMALPNYTTSGAVQGFCRAVDSSIHGRIHVLVGTSSNMGSVPFAGRDPLFWVHHSNIDRIWASWNRNGGVNPTEPSWASNEFVFADSKGNRVQSALKDYFDTEKLGYSYDDYIPAPMSQASLYMGALSASKNASGPKRVGQAKSTEMGRRPVQVDLRAITPDPSATVLGLDPARPQARTYLILKDLHTWKQPEALYHVYLTPTPGMGGVKRGAYAGDINFFDAEFHDHGTGAKMDEALGANFYSFDVTSLLQDIARSGNRNAREVLYVTFVPGGEPTPGAKPLVATIELVIQ
ncbi:MAG: tyrosinase family protein [Pseudomonadota bacterium]|nr:tyrosinase family protein [Pseudomonadota bacterium]